jgi:hypothetical protein
MARDYLSIMASSSPLEGIFSRAGDIANPAKRNRLTKRRINETICIKSWEDIIDEELPLEEQESDDSDFNGEEIISEEDTIDQGSISPRSPLTRRTRKVPIVLSDDDNLEDNDMYRRADNS